jgi:hypothetical protein
MVAQEHLQEILQEFHADHQQVMDAGGQALADGIARALEMVPDEGTEWAIVQRHPVLLVRTSSVLFQLRIDPSERSIALSSRPLRGERLTVTLEWAQPAADGGVETIETRWAFRYEGVVGEEEWQRISGRVGLQAGQETLDRRERFARNLASQAGWSPPGR